MATSLYRFFDAQGVLLYVGATSNPFRRLAEHSTTRDVTQVATVTLQWFPDRREAVLAEDEAIVSERPLWNIAKPARKRREKIGLGAGRPCDFAPSPDQERKIKRLWHDARNTQKYVLTRASEIVGMEVKRHHLTHRYGARIKKRKEQG